MAVSIGIDIGTSSVKAALYESETGFVLARAQSPGEGEIAISSPHPGWAEQDPEIWWTHTKLALAELAARSLRFAAVETIGIAYQMHGLVVLDASGNSIRPSMIWCDGRAVEAGAKLRATLGDEYCQTRLFNYPGNFTMSKLAWMISNEPDRALKIWKFMLPGDYIAFRLSGEATTTDLGLSEMALLDLSRNDVASEVLAAAGGDSGWLPTVLPCQHKVVVANQMCAELGFKGAPHLTYRAGDQPNNAMGLAVSKPGEIAANAGTSGVLFAVSDEPILDLGQATNCFKHVEGYGSLLCINGCGSAYRWLRRTLAVGYNELNAMAAAASSDGVIFLPFGNGAERMLGNTSTGASFEGLDFNRHSAGNLARAVQQGIAFAFRYGMEGLKKLGIEVKTFKAGNANMFQDRGFSALFCDVMGAPLERLSVDGAITAACMAGTGQPPAPSLEQRPALAPRGNYDAEYASWRTALEARL